jgi:hypothetical protein
MAAATALCRAPTRAVVDCYALVDEPDNCYHLVVPSLELMSFLWGQDVRVTLTGGDVRNASTPPATAARQSSNEVRGSVSQLPNLHHYPVFGRKTL